MLGYLKDYAYVRLHILSTVEEKDRNLTQAEAEAFAGKDPDMFSRDLFNSIENGAKGGYPSWRVCVQVARKIDDKTFTLPESLIFDPTKRWPENEAPLQEIGRIVLNRNVTDVFGEVEQVSFTPAAIVPGWDISADPSKCLD